MKKLLSLLLVVVIVVSFAACSGNMDASKYTKEHTLGSISYRTLANWYFEKETSNGSVYHWYCLSEDKDINSGTISIKFISADEITEEELGDTNKVNELFDEIIEGQEIEKKSDVKIASYPGIEFYREANYIDGPFKLKCCIFFLPGGIYMIEAGSLEKLNSNIESAYDELIKTIVVNESNSSNKQEES